MLIYRKIFNQKDKVRFALLLIVTLEDYRSLGYGETIFYEFIDKIKAKNKKTEIVLHSLKKSENFYLNLGFKKINNNRFLENLEGINSDEKDKIFMKYLF